MKSHNLKIFYYRKQHGHLNLFTLFSLMVHFCIRMSCTYTFIRWYIIANFPAMTYEELYEELLIVTIKFFLDFDRRHWRSIYKFRMILNINVYSFNFDWILLIISRISRKTYLHMINSLLLTINEIGKWDIGCESNRISTVPFSFVRDGNGIFITGHPPISLRLILSSYSMVSLRYTLEKKNYLAMDIWIRDCQVIKINPNHVLLPNEDTAP